MTARRIRKKRRRASRREWIAFVALLFVVGAGMQVVARLEVNPMWLLLAAAFTAGVLVTVCWQRWVARTAYRFGYVKVRGRW
ncbi:hypothetical protein [Nonomuraea sp. NPDC049158]|uniref:hypothetical protein n=1 Tax=Nonomuraea sp. NPDC049158 TaxID=3155649 RepID=UPI0033EE3DC1